MVRQKFVRATKRFVVFCDQKNYLGAHLERELIFHDVYNSINSRRNSRPTIFRVRKHGFSLSHKKGGRRERERERDVSPLCSAARGNFDSRFDLWRAHSTTRLLRDSSEIRSAIFYRPNVFIVQSAIGLFYLRQTRDSVTQRTRRTTNGVRGMTLAIFRFLRDFPPPPPPDE